MIVWVDGKGPAEDGPWDLDWSVRLAGADTIASSEWSITAGDTGAEGTLVLGASTFSTTETQIVLSAGNLPVVYELQNVITTASGAEWTEKVQLPMRNR